jgi:hypothetical protein
MQWTKSEHRDLWLQAKNTSYVTWSSCWHGSFGGTRLFKFMEVKLLLPVSGFNSSTFLSSPSIIFIAKSSFQLPLAGHASEAQTSFVTGS